MNHFKLNRITKATALAASLVLAGCLVDQANTPASEEGTASIDMRVGLDPVSTALSKGSVISLSKMIVVLTSSAKDTIRDTITSGTTPALNATSTTAQTVGKSYTLKPLRTWKAVVTVRDSKDSVIHKDSATTPVLQVNDSVTLTLNLSSKFVMYQAKFQNIPDSISSSAVGTSKQKLNLNRLVFKVDGVTVKDSTVSPSFFAAGGTYTLFHDYVKPGSRTVQLLAYGPLANWNIANPLYSGSTTINVGAGVDSTVSLNLAWVGPTTGTGSLSVTVGKVGTVVVNGGVPGVIIND